MPLLVKVRPMTRMLRRPSMLCTSHLFMFVATAYVPLMRSVTTATALTETVARTAPLTSDTSALSTSLAVLASVISLTIASLATVKMTQLALTQLETTVAFAPLVLKERIVLPTSMNALWELILATRTQHVPTTLAIIPVSVSQGLLAMVKVASTSTSVLLVISPTGRTRASMTETAPRLRSPTSSATVAHRCLESDVGLLLTFALQTVDLVHATLQPPNLVRPRAQLWMSVTRRVSALRGMKGTTALSR
mmetsp:Transcript_12443/g.17941  ORF Transcript_12443/g.17941 Transcript_12443/m.17941 type:complete len:250 (-) Transcript_12443:2592-3341(-)